MEGGQGDSIVLEEEIDPNYEPTEKEVLEYATWLGMDLEAERDLFWIAREGLKAPLPENWKPCKTTDTEEIYYFNFASGQSTWDHPCDEFYRNLYEEHKKKHQSKGNEDTDERKKKVKEDVAELLGRKNGGKKKKAKAEKLSGGPLLGKVNALDKKPLPGLPGKLGSLSLGGLGLKPVAGLGPLKSEAKELTGPGIELDINADEFRGGGMAKPLSKTPLGSTLGKKPLVSSPSVTTNADLVSSEFDEKCEKLGQDHSRKLREIQDSHESELDVLRKKLKAQFEDVQDAEEMKLRQLKREFDKKKNELENEFDREENAIQRRRKDRLKQLEKETEKEVARKKEELDHEYKSDIDKLRLMHEGKQRKIQEGFEEEAKRLTEQIESLFGEKKEAAQLAIELKAEVERLRHQCEDFEQELSGLRSEKASLCRDKEAVEKERDDIKRDLEDVRKRLAEETRLEAPASCPKECTNCTALATQLSVLTSECTDAQDKIVKLETELAALIQEAEAQATTKREKDEQIAAFHGQDLVRQQEIKELQQELALFQAKSSELTVKCTALENTIATVSQDKSPSVSEESMLRQLTAAQAEVAKTKNEYNDLQDQHAAMLATNAQMEEQLRKEANEQKLLREQFESRSETAAQMEKYQQDLQVLQVQIKRESQCRQEQEDACNKLQSELEALTQAKRQADDEVRRLKGDTHLRNCEALNHSDETQYSADLKKEIDRLQHEQKSLQQEFDAICNEREGLLQSKDAVDRQYQLARSEIEDLHKQLLEAVQPDPAAATSQKCKLCLALEDQVLAVENKCTATHIELVKAREELEKQKQESEALAIAERAKAETAIASLQQRKDDEARVFRDQEARLKQEIEVLEQKVNCLEAESSNLRSQRALLENGTECADSRELNASSSASKAHEQLEILKCQLAACRTEAASTKAELHDLQRQYAALLAKATQAKEQLIVESNEKKALREQLDIKLEEATQYTKQQHQILALQEQLESECRARREREDACDALRKEVHTLEQARRAVDAELSRLESDKRHVEAEKSMLALRLDEMTMFRQRDEKSVVSVEEALANKKVEVEQLRVSLKVAEVDKDHSAARMKVLNKDLEQMQTRMHQVEIECEAERARSRTSEKERDTALQRQQSSMDQIESLQRKCRTLTLEVSELQDLLSKVKGTEQAVTSKADKATAKIRELEGQVERESFAVQMKLQQAQVEHENTRHLKERAELQVQAREKELAVARDEVARRESEIEALEARIKALLSNTEEVQAALLSANLANAASASDNREASRTSSDVMLVKLQLADANRTELELHLADISSQLEKATRQCTLMEGRCRDQSIELESLHVEIASLRSASKKMHLSALESLTFVERLEYEHKKRTLRSDYLTQLRDFQEREEKALVRHKARLRAQYERQVDELVAELEKMQHERVGQEEALAVQMMQEIRQERELKRSEAKRQVREELKQFEQELHERKVSDIAMISKGIEREQEELSARYRELRQVAREQELAKQSDTQHKEGKSETSRDVQRPASPGQLVHLQSARRFQLESLDGDDDDDDDGGSQDCGPASRTYECNQVDHRRPGRKKSTQMYEKWKKRLQKEVGLLAHARALIVSQREGLAKQIHELQASKHELKRNSSSLGTTNPIQREVKRILNENMANCNDGMKKLRKQEAWVKQREQKLARMRCTVKRLKYRHRDVYGNNNMPDPSDSDEEEEICGEWSDYSNESDFASALRRDEEEDRGFQREFPRDGRYPALSALCHLPHTYTFQRSYRYPLSSSGGQFVPTRGFQAARDLVDYDPRWLHSQRTTFGRRGDGLAVTPVFNHTEHVYKQKLSRWANDRKKVQHAATNHATWLSDLCDELKEYGAKYTRVEGKPEEATRDVQLVQED